MYKFLKIMLLIAVSITSLTFGSTHIVFGQESQSCIDKSQLNKGIITVNYRVQKGVTTKVQITYGDVKNTYDLKSKSSFPLQLGNGIYKVFILELVKENKYRVVENEEITLQLEDENTVFLQNIQIVNWNKNMKAIQKAKELTADSKTELDKVNEIYSYILKNVKYDNEKAKKVKTDYIPSIVDVFKDNKGICYDYSALLAAMLRSINIPTKLVMGYNEDITGYHAWNQVYLADTNEWITVDVTYDAGLGKMPSDKMIKDAKEYSIEMQY